MLCAVFSVNGTQVLLDNLLLSGITNDKSTGDAGALSHKMDAFDVGSSTNVAI